MATNNDRGQMPAIKKTTAELIGQLSEHMSKTPSADSELKFFVKWLAISTFFVTLVLFVTPFDFNVQTRAQNPWFVINTIFWFAGTALSALIIHRSRTPGLKVASYDLSAILVIGLLLFVVAARLPSEQIGTDFQSEMNWHRGLCGPIILGMGVAWGAGLFWWTRKGAPTRLARTGLWIGLSAGCLSSLAMQVICAHENPLHILIWHALPVALLTSSGYFAGRRWLSW